MEIKNDNIVEWDIDTSTDIFMIVLSIDATDKGNIENISELENELYIEPIKLEWRSKYNSHVVYDYEPFCLDGYNHSRYYPMGDRTDFLKYLINKHMSNLNVLETYYNMEDYIDGKHSKNTVKIQQKRNDSKKNVGRSVDNITS